MGQCDHTTYQLTYASRPAHQSQLGGQGVTIIFTNQKIIEQFHTKEQKRTHTIQKKLKNKPRNTCKFVKKNRLVTFENCVATKSKKLPKKMLTKSKLWSFQK